MSECQQWDGLKRPHDTRREEQEEEEEEEEGPSNLQETEWTGFSRERKGERMTEAWSRLLLVFAARRETPRTLHRWRRARM